MGKNGSVREIEKESKRQINDKLAAYSALKKIRYDSIKLLLHRKNYPFNISAKPISQSDKFIAILRKVDFVQLGSKLESSENRVTNVTFIIINPISQRIIEKVFSSIALIIENVFVITTEDILFNCRFLVNKIV